MVSQETWLDDQLNGIREHYATNAALADVRGELRAEIANARAEIANAKTEMVKWFIGTSIALVIAVAGVSVALVTILGD